MDFTETLKEIVAVAPLGTRVACNTLVHENACSTKVAVGCKGLALGVRKAPLSTVFAGHQELKPAPLTLARTAKTHSKAIWNHEMLSFGKVRKTCIN